MREVTGKLNEHGLLQEVYGEEITFQPARNLELISVMDVCHAMRHEDDMTWHVSDEEKNERLDILMNDRKKAESDQQGKVTMLDLFQGGELIATR